MVDIDRVVQCSVQPHEMEYLDPVLPPVWRGGSEEGREEGEWVKR